MTATIFASRDMAAKLCRAAGFDGRHDFQLPEAYMPGVGLALGCPVAAEDIRNLQRGTRHTPEAASQASGPVIAITAVPHTWGSAKTDLPHVHIIAPGSSLSDGGERPGLLQADFLLPVANLATNMAKLT